MIEITHSEVDEDINEEEQIDEGVDADEQGSFHDLWHESYLHWNSKSIEDGKNDYEGLPLKDEWI